MKKALYLAVICLCLWLPVRQAHAAYVTGGDLVKSCSSDDTQDLFSCMHYIAGVIDYHVMMQSLGTAPTTDFCLPENLPLEKAAVVVMRYLKKSPQHTDFIAAPAVIMALHEKFPCGPIRVPVEKTKKVQKNKKK